MIYCFLISDENQNLPMTLELNFQHKSGNNISFVNTMIPFYNDSFDFLGVRGMSRRLDGTYQEKTNLDDKKIELINEKEKVPIKDDIINSVIIKDPLVKSIGKNEFDFYFLFDKNNNIVECSNDMTQKLGFDKSEILSLSLDDIDCLYKKDDIKNKVKKVRDQGKMIFKTMYRKKDKKTILVNETICYLKDRDLFKCFVKEEAYSKQI